MFFDFCFVEYWLIEIYVGDCDGWCEFVVEGEGDVIVVGGEIEDVVWVGVLYGGYEFMVLFEVYVFV